jgi:hypothetical protein
MSIIGSIAGGGASAGGSGTISGTVGITDNRLVRSDGVSGSVLQSTGVTVTDSNQLSGALFGSRPSSGSITLDSSQSSCVVTIDSQDGADSVVLPASPTVGQWYSFVVLSAAAPLTVVAQGSHAIYVNGSASSAGGSATGSTMGLRLDLVYAGPSVWSGIASGTWTLA